MTKLEEIASAFEVNADDVKKEFDNEVKTLVETMGMPKESAEQIAVDVVRATFRARKLKKLAVFEGVILGTDGRVMNWAVTAKNKVRAKMKGLTQEQAIEQGLVDENGRMLYVDDQYREGRAIPSEDISINYYGVFADGGSPKFGVLEIKNREALSQIKSGMLVQVEGNKLQKSSEKVLALRTKEVPKLVKSVDNSKVMEYIHKFVPVVDVPYLVQKGTLGQPFILKRLIIRSVRYGVGDNGVTVVELDPGATDVLDTISLWLPPKDQIGETLVKSLPINVFGVSSGVRDNRIAGVNGIKIWYDEEFKPKLVPKEIKPDERKETKEIVW